MLVVDDTADVRDATVELLRAHGYETLAAENGQQALELLQRTGERPCLIVLDLAMPVMDGATFRMKLLWDHPQFAQIPVIIVSASTQNARALEQLAVADCMPKPFDPDRLLALIERHCRARS